MKISEQWLREWVAVRQDAKALAERLTLAGIEVGAVTPVAAPLEHIVVGEILSITPHPQADRLRVCQVNIGKQAPLTIVCGAANAAAGLKVPTALEGALLPNGTKITRTAIRGVNSFGMLCAGAELGLEETSQGLMVLDARAKPGTAITRHLQLDDHQLEVELTPNRGDCLSIMGLARELAALTGARFTPMAVKPVTARTRRKLGVTLGAKKACARYAGRVIEGISPHASTPLWMKERLRRSGVRSIHPVVNVTNYVMLELGQPLHAFDLDKLSGNITARHAHKGEALDLLDGKKLTLDPADLVIADARAPVALAGIMGGQDSAVGSVTQNLFLESAWFRPEAIGTRARFYGLHTDSSHRFERGVDPALQRQALERATALILAICGGKPGPVTEKSSAAHLPKRPAILLRAARIERVLGMSIPPVSVEAILKRLGMRTIRSAAGKTGRSWKVTPPGWRSDIGREIDLIEELVRVHGYEKVPARVPLAALHVPAVSESRIAARRLRDVLIDRDYQEAITYGFVDPVLQSLLSPGGSPHTLANPIASDLAQMRLTLWPGLIKAALYNQNRQQERVRLFEIGKRFLTKPDGTADEQAVIAGIATGPAFPEQWGSKARPVDFFDVKGDIEALLALGGQRQFLFRPAHHPALHPGQAAEIVHSGNKDCPIGLLGVLHPLIQAKSGLEKSAIIFELRISALQAAFIPEFREISRYPAIRRDLALVLAEAISAQDVLDNVRKTAGGLLANLELFDEYRGEGIDSGRKSLALGLTLQDTSRTLNEEDVEAVIGRVVAGLKADFEAQLRQ
ncbi:MAG TPA: phenylalanine--tRNA ligase subunit beta [Acidiferrobacterales bacterium]|nr:phenylalanine--tRNA ligase subunit beta [Acidiferrobacterales bacterium]